MLVVGVRAAVGVCDRAIVIVSVLLFVPAEGGGREGGGGVVGIVDGADEEELEEFEDGGVGPSSVRVAVMD